MVAVGGRLTSLVVTMLMPLEFQRKRLRSAGRLALLNDPANQNTSPNWRSVRNGEYEGARGRQRI